MGPCWKAFDSVKVFQSSFSLGYLMTAHMMKASTLLEEVGKTRTPYFKKKYFMISNMMELTMVPGIFESCRRVLTKEK